MGFQPDTIYANIHTEAYNHIKGTQKGSSIFLKQPYTRFNTYAVEWFENRIDFFVNGIQYFSFEKEQADSTVWPFDQPHFLIMNLAIGGGWGGQKGIDDNIFPQKYYIDYVRIYQNPDNH